MDIIRPKTLEECYPALKKKLSSSQLKYFKEMIEDNVRASYHMGLGKQLRNHWGLWAGSELAVWFKDIGITHADDMSGIILLSFHRRLNDKPILLEEQVQHYQAYWKKYEKHVKNRG